jgi:hypothetical protein
MTQAHEDDASALAKPVRWIPRLLALLACLAAVFVALRAGAAWSGGGAPDGEFAAPPLGQGVAPSSTLEEASPASNSEGWASRSAAPSSAGDHFKNAGTGLALEGEGVVHLSGSGAARAVLEVSGGTCLVTSEVSDSLGPVVFVEGLEVGGLPYTYLEFDLDWASLPDPAVLDVLPGLALPCVARSANGEPHRRPLQLHPHQNAGVMVAGAYPDLYAEVESPFAVPVRPGGGTVEVESEDAWCRILLDDHLAEGHEFTGSAPRVVELRRVGGVSVSVRSPSKLDGLSLVLSPLVDGAVDFASGRGSIVVPLQGPGWLAEGSGWLLQAALEGVLAGQYRPTLLGFESERRVQVSPAELELDPEAGATVEVRLDMGPPSPLTPTSVRIWFDEPVADLLGELGDALYCGLYGLDPGMPAAGQPVYFGQHLSAGELIPGDTNSLLLRPRGSLGLAAGRYHIQIQPLGYGAEVVVEPSSPVVDFVVPPLSRVSLTGRTYAELSAQFDLPRVTQPSRPDLVGMPGAVRATEESGRLASYVLAYGEYGLEYGIGLRGSPANFFADRPELTVECGLVDSYSRSIAWERQGRPVKLNLMSLSGLRVSRGGQPVEGSQIAGRGFSLGHQRVDALTVTVPEPGVYEVRYEINLPNGDKIERVVSEFAVLEVESPDLVDNLDE